MTPTGRCPAHRPVGGRRVDAGPVVRSGCTHVERSRTRADDPNLDFRRTLSLRSDGCTPHVETATELLANAPDRVYYGRALSTLADVQERLGNLDAALATTVAASEILRPTVAPNPAVGAASRLASLHAQAERWPDAARAYRDALEASELISCPLCTSSIRSVTCRLGWVPSQDSRRLGRRPGYARTECASPWTTTSTSTSRWTSTASRKQRLQGFPGDDGVGLRGGLAGARRHAHGSVLTDVSTAA